MQEIEEDPDVLPSVNTQRSFFPMCIVWTPLPILTWLCPAVGHLGISTTDGLIHDFAGAFWINKSHRALAFGPVTKYYHVTPADFPDCGAVDSLAGSWDRAIDVASGDFGETHHQICFNNCHHHVAAALNQLNFRAKRNWNTTSLIVFMVLHGKYPSFGRLVAVYFLLLLAAVAALIYLLISSL